MKLLIYLFLMLAPICKLFGVVLTLVDSPIVIGDNDPVGLGFTAEVENVQSAIESVTVTLETSGGFNGDLYAFLSFDSELVVLLNRPGISSTNTFGFLDSGFDVTFADTLPLAADPHTTGGIGGVVSGSFSSDGRAISPFSAPVDFDTAERTATLANLEGLDPNGTWAFFIADLSGGGLATLESLEISIVTVVPEPSSLGVILGSLVLFYVGYRRR